MFNRFKALVDLLPGHLTPTQHYRNLAVIGVALLIVIGLIAGWNIVFSILCVLMGGFAALLAYDWLASQPTGSGGFRQASERIGTGAQLFLLDLYKNIVWLSIFVAILIALMINWSAAIGFFVGVLVSELIGYFGCKITLYTRPVTLHATSRSLFEATKLALSSGVMSGLLVTGTALFLLAFYYTLMLASNTDYMVSILAGLAAGAASVSLFVSVSSTIFVKTSIASSEKASQDNVAGIQSQPVNIIQTIAEHIADCTAVITDIFATIVAAIAATIVINNHYDISQLVSYPMTIIATAIISAVVVLQVLQRLNTDMTPALLLKRLLIVFAMLNAIVLLPITWWMFDQSQLQQLGISIANVYYSVLIGLFLGMALCAVSYYNQLKPFSSLTNASKSAKFTVVMVAAIVFISLYVAYGLAGLIGVEITIISLISLSAMMVAVSTFSCLIRPQQSPLSAQDQTAQHHLGLMTKAVTQTYALAASTLVALMITMAFVVQFSSDTVFSMLNIPFVVGIVIGVVIVFLFCALLIKTVSRVTAGAKQISSSHHAVTQLAKRCQRELLIPVLVPLVLSVLIAYLFGNKVVSGLTIGVGFGGLLIGLAALIGGDAWVFVMRYLEYFWSAAKQPSGWDTVAAEQSITDGYRDSIVASLSPLIKMIAIIALLMSM